MLLQSDSSTSLGSSTGHDANCLAGSTGTPGLGKGLGLGLITGVTVTRGEGGGIRGSAGLGLGIMIGGLGTTYEGNAHRQLKKSKCDQDSGNNNKAGLGTTSGTFKAWSHQQLTLPTGPRI